jgi:hypothetical protein
MLNLVELEWPGGVSTILSGMQLSLFKLDVLQGAACFLSFKTTFYLALYFPFALAGTLLAVLGLSTQMTRELRWGWLQKAWASIGIRADDHFRHRGRFRIRALLVRSYLSFLSSSYSYLAWSSVQLFQCTDIGDNSGPRLYAFAEIVCYSSEWYSLFPSALLGLVLYVVGIPLLQLMMLRRFSWGEHEDAAAFLGYRVTGYKHGFRWWDSIDIVWRLCVALSIQLLMEHPTAQIVLFTALVGGRLAAQRHLRPFAESQNNVQEHMLQWLTLGVLACGVVFYSLNSRLSDAAQAFLYVMVIGFLLVIVLSVARSTVLAYQRRKCFDSDGSHQQQDSRSSSSRAESHDGDADCIDPAALQLSASRGAGSDFPPVALSQHRHAASIRVDGNDKDFEDASVQDVYDDRCEEPEPRRTDTRGSALTSQGDLLEPLVGWKQDNDAAKRKSKNLN